MPIAQIPVSPPREKLLAEGFRYYKTKAGKEILLAPPVQLEFVDHQKAPLFKDHSEGRKLIKNLIDKIKKEGESFEFTPEVLEVYRQAGLVSLWFFLKFIAGFSGPYNKLNDSLHVSMANYRQKQLKPGNRGAFFIFRSAYKSTIGTHGANAWEIYRNPNIRIGMISSKIEMSQLFMHATMKVFDSNPLMEILAPELVPAKDPDGKIKTGIDWTAKQFTSPGRTRDLPEPTMKCGAAGGSTQGIHCDLLSIDDIVGEKELNAFHEASEDMLKKAAWLSSNAETLLLDPEESRVFLAATRYALDDPYEEIMQNAYEHVGNWSDVDYPIVPKPNGVWSVYYRQALENNRLTLPERVSREFLIRIKRTNYWLWATQYMNNAQAVELSEFSDYRIKEAQLDYTPQRGFVVTYQKEGVPFTQSLSSMEVIIGVDPGASESRKSMKTSRTAIVVRARDKFDKRIYLDGAIGYFSPTEFYDNLFRLYSKFKDYIKSTNFESGGPFKFVYNTLLEEQKKRRIFLGLRKLNPLPDKNAKIRNFLQPLLEFNLIYAVEGIYSYIYDEVKTFPGGNLKDTLDAMELADRLSTKPLTSEELRREQESKNYRKRVRSRAGY